MKLHDVTSAMTIATVGIILTALLFGNFLPKWAAVSLFVLQYGLTWTAIRYRVIGFRQTTADFQHRLNSANEAVEYWRSHSHNMEQVIEYISAKLAGPWSFMQRGTNHIKEVFDEWRAAHPASLAEIRHKRREFDEDYGPRCAHGLPAILCSNHRTVEDGVNSGIPLVVLPPVGFVARVGTLDRGRVDVEYFAKADVIEALKRSDVKYK